MIVMDVQSRFATLLNPIRDLTKNWAVDVAAELEEYLNEVCEEIEGNDKGGGRGEGGGGRRRALEGT